MPLVSRTFDQLIDFTRTSSATFVGSNGLIQSTPQSRNLLTFTQEFDNAAWAKNGTTALPFDPATATLGAECVANGGFDSGASWSGPVAGASITGGALVFDGVTSIGISITSNTPAIPIVAGRWYVATFTIVSGTTNGVSLNLGGALGTPRTAAGTYTEYLFATTTAAMDISPRGGTGIRTGSIDNVSVKEVIGGLITAPDGTSTADKLVETATTGVHNASRTITTTAVPYTWSCYIKAAERTFAFLYHTQTNASVSIDLATGATGTASGTVAPTASSVTSVGNGWYRVAMTVTATAAGNFFGVYAATSLSGSASYTGDGTSGIYVWGAQLEAVPDANLVLGSELRGSGVVSTLGTPSPIATYNSTTGEATLNRVDGSNVSGIRVPVGGAGRSIRVSVTISAATAVVQVRGNGVAGTIIGTVGPTAGTYVLYVVSDTTDIYFTMGSNSSTATITINSVKEITGTVGMPSDYTRNFGGLFPPRFDYDPVTLAPRGLLIEEQRTNLLTYSEQFDNAAWTKSNSTVTANATTSPDGTVDADKIVETATTAAFSAVQAPTMALSTSHTFSCYMKAAERSFGVMNIFTGTASCWTWFDLSSGTVATLGAGATATITPARDGWYRCTLTIATAASGTPNVAIWPAATNGVLSYAGTAGSGIFVWGAQLEAGAFATSYIPTVASQVTRTADTALIQAPNFAPWYRQNAGTIVAEWALNHANATGRYIVKGSSPTVGAGVGPWVNSNGIDTRAWVGGTSITVGNASLTAPNKVAFGYSPLNNAASLNGASAVANTTATAPADVNLLEIGGSGASQLNGHIRSIRYYPVRLSDAQLQALTA